MCANITLKIAQGEKKTALDQVDKNMDKYVIEGDLAVVVGVRVCVWGCGWNVRG